MSMTNKRDVDVFMANELKSLFTMIHFSILILLWMFSSTSGLEIETQIITVDLKSDSPVG